MKCIAVGKQSLTKTSLVAVPTAKSTTLVELYEFQSTQ